MCLTLCIFSANFIITGFCLFIIGLITTWVRSHYQAIQQIFTDQNFNGKVASFRMIINQGSVVIISPLLGLVGATFGIKVIFGVLATIAITAYLINIKLNEDVVI